MTWTPKDGPSREELAQRAAVSHPDGWAFAGAQLGLAAHDLYEENQRLKADRWPLDEAVAACDHLWKATGLDCVLAAGLINRLRAELTVAVKVPRQVPRQGTKRRAKKRAKK